MTKENRAATDPQMARCRPPGGNRAMTSATAVTDAAMAWPEGKDAPDVATNEWGGRGRSYRFLSVPMQISEITIADRNAVKCHQRRRTPRKTSTIARIGSVTQMAPRALKTSATGRN